MSGVQQQREPAGDGTRNVAAMSQEEVEALALTMGWRPKEEYLAKGRDATRFVEARDFVETAERNPAIMWSNLHTMQKRMEQNERDRKRADDAWRKKFDESLTVINDLSENVRTVSKTSYERAKRELAAQRDAAIEAGDKDAFRRADTEIAELERGKPAEKQGNGNNGHTPPAATAAPTVPSSEVQEWGRKNPWFYTDTELQARANAIHIALLGTAPNLSLSENLEEVERTIKTMFPDKFPKPRRAAGRSEEEPEDGAAAGERPNGPSAGSSRRTKRDFNSLPADSKRAFQKYATMIGNKQGAKPLTQEEWASNYYEQFAEEA